MTFRFERLDIPDVILIHAHALHDARGFFLEGYKRSEFAAHGVPEVFVQLNYSHSVRGVLRGIHYQLPPRAQGKLVSVIRGTIFDVAVDLRRGSSTYGRWVAVTLSAEAHPLVYVPVGFAHGFCVVSEEADVIYDVTEEYAPEMERGIRWNDPALGIPWPVKQPILTPKDASWPWLQDAEDSFVFPRAQP